MATTKFQLQPAIEDFINRLKIKGGFTPEDLDELKSHLFETTAALQEKGLSEEESFLVSTSRMGNENELATEYQKVNGKISGNASLLFIFIGMWLLTLFYFLWSLLKVIELNFLLRYNNTPLTSFFIKLIPSLSMIIVLFVVLNAGKLMAILEKSFFKNRGNFSVIYFATAFALFGSLAFLTGIIAMNNNSLLMSRHNGVFALNNSTSEITFGIMLAAIILISLYMLIKNGDKRKGISNLLNKGGIAFYIGLGILWETISAFTRFITKDANLLLSAAVYGTVFSAAVFLLAISIKERPFQKIMIFSAFAILIEFYGVFLNPLLGMGTLLSVYFYFLAAGIVIAYISGRLIYDKKVLKPGSV